MVTDYHPVNTLVKIEQPSFPFHQNHDESISTAEENEWYYLTVMGRRVSRVETKLEGEPMEL